MLQEIRHALRLLARNPGFTMIAALSLALGIGANSAIFSLADALLLRPLPVLEPSRVVTISTDPQVALAAFPPPTIATSASSYARLRVSQRSITGHLASQSPRRKLRRCALPCW